MTRLTSFFIATALLLAVQLSASFSLAAGPKAFSGEFRGLNDHITTGSVTILNTENGGSVLVLGEDFSLDGAPDPSVGLGNDGKYVPLTNLGKMTKIKGFQIYQIPNDLDWSTYDEVYIWCEKFTVALGVASIK